MVEAVSDIKRELGVHAVVIRAFLYRPFYIDDEIAGCAVFAWNGIAAEADDVRWPVFAEEFTIILSNTGIIRQQ